MADGTWARNRYTLKHVLLSRDCRQVLWDDGKKSVDLSQVVRVSIGLETRTLQRLYSGASGASTDVAPFHWFSLHTQTRSFDFGAASTEASGDPNETIVAWVLTLQHMVVTLGAAGGAPAGSCCALSNAQYQWQRFDNVSGRRRLRQLIPDPAKVRAFAGGVGGEF